MPDPQIDYTSKDFQSIKDTLIKAIPFLTEEWTDHNTDDFGIVLIELFSGMGDVLHWYIDRMANENFWGTALARRSIVELGKLIGFRIKGVSAARAPIRITLTSPSPQTISTGKQFIGNGINFILESDLVFGAGETSKDGFIIEGLPVSELTFIPDVAGIPFQKFPVFDTDIIEDSISVKVGVDIWSYTDKLGLARADDKVWTYSRDEDDLVTIEFGNGGGTSAGGSGLIPTADIKVNYRTGVGVNGNIPKGTALAESTPSIPNLSSIITLEAGSGGGDIENLESARVRGPSARRSNDRAVKLLDYSSLAAGISGVSKAQAIVLRPTEVTIFVYPNGGGTANTSLLQSVVLQLNTKRMITDSLSAKPVKELKINGDITVTLFSDANRDLVGTEINNFLISQFNESNTKIGITGNRAGNVFLSDIVGGIEAINGVDTLDITSLYFDPYIVEEHQRGDVVLSSSTVTSELREETWTMTFLTANTYRVEGSKSGAQTNIGTFSGGSSTFTTDNSEVIFNFTRTVSNAKGDRLLIRTSSFLGNVPINTGEIAILENITDITVTLIGGVV